jgi:hypothetical protein
MERFLNVSRRQTLIVTFLLAFTSAAGADAQAPHVTSARVYVSEDFLVSDIVSSGLFTEEIEGTVKSGLPAVVELLFSLDNAARDVLRRGVLSYELRYDVWEDRYAVTDVDSTCIYTSFIEMTRAVQNLERITIAPLDIMDPGSDYMLRLSIRVYPLRGRDQRTIVGWVGETVRGGGAESREQLLNLNDLIEHFFAREKREAGGGWFETNRFRPGGLPRAPRGEP